MDLIQHFEDNLNSNFTNGQNVPTSSKLPRLPKPLLTRNITTENSKIHKNSTQSLTIQSPGPTSSYERSIESIAAKLFSINHSPKDYPELTLTEATPDRIANSLKLRIIEIILFK